jgi:hypothetical protein
MKIAKPNLPGIIFISVLLTAQISCGKSSQTTHPTLLDGDDKSFVIVGYSTSYAWPEILQEMLDEHSDGQRKYHVLNAVIGGSPVETWIAHPDSADYQKTFGAMLADFFGDDARLRSAAPAPTVALCQQSLQFTRTRRGPIARTDDEEGIRIGADAMEKLAMQLQEHGIRQVYYGMHIYKHPVEPEVGNERLALAALLKRSHHFIFEGPDVWEPTKRGYPELFAEDGVHPNDKGMKIMAEAWYRTVAGDLAQQEIIDRMHAKDYEVDKMMDTYRIWRRGS